MPGKRDFTVYCAMFEMLMFFEKLPTFYLKQLLKNHKCLITLSYPAGCYYQIKEYHPAGRIKIKAAFVCFYITVTLQCRPCSLWVPILSPEEANMHMSDCISENGLVLLNHLSLESSTAQQNMLKVQRHLFLFTSALTIYCYIAMQCCL